MGAWNERNRAVVNVTGVDSLEELTDVVLNTPLNEQVLVFNSTTNLWENQTLDVISSATLTESIRTSGTLVVPSYLDNGDGSVTIGSGEYSLYDNPNYLGLPSTYTVAGGTFILTDETANYIIVSYAGGTPVMSVITSVPSPATTDSDLIPVFSCYRSGTDIHTFNWDRLSSGLAEKLNQRLRRTDRFRIDTGLVVSETPTRIISITSGSVWAGAHLIDLISLLSNVNPVHFYHHSASAWVRSTLTQYNNTQYDDGTNLVALSNNKYAVNWIYRSVDNNGAMYVLLGNGDYNLAEAQASAEPTKPSEVSTQGVLLGRIIVEKSIDTATQIDRIQSVAFISSPASNHNDLALIQGGTAEERYHLTLAEYTLTNSHPTDLANPHAVTKTQVGLGDVDNTSDINKPISTATQNALNLKSDSTHLHTGVYEPANANIQSHISSTSNPHAVTKTQVGLSNVDNTSDATKNAAVATLTNKTLTSSVINTPTLGTEDVTITTNNLPDIRPTLLLRPASSKVTDQRISVTRASTATTFDAKGVLTTVAANVLRIYHDPVTLECLGWLIEEARTNLAIQSGFAGAVSGSPGTAPTSWALTVAGTPSLTVGNARYGTADSAKALTFSGATTGDRLYVQQLINVTSGVQYAFHIDVEGVSGNIGHLFTIVAGTASGTINTPVISPSEPGRYTFLFTANATGTIYIRCGMGCTSGISAAASVKVSRIQCEAGSFATSYIPTTSATVTRAADLPVMTGANFSSWYRQDEGTFVVKSACFAGINDVDNATLTVGDGTASNYMFPAFSNLAGTLRVNGNVYVGGLSQLSGANSATNSYLQDGTFHTEVLSYKANDFKWASSIGPTLVTDTSGSVPTVTKMMIGSYYIEGNRMLNGYISHIAYYPKSLTSAEVAALAAQ